VNFPEGVVSKVSLFMEFYEMWGYAGDVEVLRWRYVGRGAEELR
jgi:hypothetical protein